jgi:hypothetical protein
VLSQLGLAFHIEFSHARAGKQIRWQQSSRLQQGTMVALSPANDNFRSICKIAIVAARPLEGGLDQNPPQIDIFWGEVDDAVFDPVECKSEFWLRTLLIQLQRTQCSRLARAISNLPDTCWSHCRSCELSSKSTTYLTLPRSINSRF